MIGAQAEQEVREPNGFREMPIGKSGSRTASYARPEDYPESSLGSPVLSPNFSVGTPRLPSSVSSDPRGRLRIPYD